MGVVACEVGGLVEADGAGRLLAGVQAGAEAMQEGDGAEAGVGGGAGAGAA
jgi:hypothetical protein